MADEQAVAEPEKKVAYTGNTVKKGEIQKMAVNIPLADQINPQNQQPAATQPPPKTQADIDAEENIAQGLNPDGTPKIAPTTELTQEIKDKNIAAGLNEDGTAKAAAPATNEPAKPLTDEEFKAEYEKRFPTTAEATPEEKEKAAKAFDKRMLDLYLETGGTVEQYALLKSIAAADLTEVSDRQLEAELKNAGITDPEQIKAIKKERYYQLEQAEIDAIEDEDEKALAQKKLDFGKKKLEAKGANKKEEAVDFFNTLKEAITQKDAYFKKEEDFSANVVEHFKNVERKMTLQLGKVDDTDIAPVEFEVPEEVITAAMDELKTPAARKQLLFNPTDGSLNLKSIAELVLKAKMFDSAAKTAYLTGGHREVEKFETIFPNRSAAAVGVGSNGQKQGVKGKIVSAGQPQRFKPAVNQ